jgi:hypothetical protein
MTGGDGTTIMREDDGAITDGREDEKKNGEED